MTFTAPASTESIFFRPIETSALPAREHESKIPFRSKLFQFKRHENLQFRSRGLWRIEEGFVRSLSWNIEGEPVPLGFWCRGDIVGYPIAQARPYEIQCLTPVTAEYLGSAYSFSREVALAQVSQSNDLLRIVHCRQAERRLLLFLCWLAQRFGKTVADGRQIQPKLTHQEIADSIGSTRVTVTRLLKDLERENKIRCSSREKVVKAQAFEESCEHIYSLEEVG